MRFKQFYTEENIDEALITFGKEAYPKFGNIVILAGGAGSGKGFVLENLIGLEGKVFDVDALKLMTMNSKKAQEKFPELADMAKDAKALKNPENVRKLHAMVKELGYEKGRLGAISQSIMTQPPERKPNLIFDVTLSDPKKLTSISEMALSLGYPKENIHIVWVLNDIDVAIKQNKTRNRTVPQDILIDTHQGAGETMMGIITGGEGVRKYMDGVIAIVLNRVGLDAVVDIKPRSEPHTANVGIGKSSASGETILVIDKAIYTIVKEKGESVKPQEEIKKDLQTKIHYIVPREANRASKDWIKDVAKGKIKPTDK